MAPPQNPSSIANSPTPGPSMKGGRHRTAEALYAWCQKNREIGHVFSQEELLSAGIIPNRDLQILLSSVEHLVNNSLFRLHDRSGGTIGWELVDQEKAKNYTNLTRDERMVLFLIDAAGNSGIWTKVIKFRSQLHSRVLDRVYKNLEAKGLIKPMKHVNHPNRKMFILAGLEPSEEATGGAWFSDGHLDVGLVDTISQVIEHFVSTNSWRQVEQGELEDEPQSPGRKRKAPAAGFEDRGEQRAKAAKSNEAQRKGKGPKPIPQRTYQPFPAGHRSYPTLRDITRHILDIKVTQTILPQNAILQLLDVMVYDDRLFKMYRPPNDDEFPDDPAANTITMYRCFKNPTELFELHQLEKRKVSSHDSTRKAAYRQQELEDIAEGGSSEVPCMRCPAFDICGDGGPVNVVTCRYFEPWYVNLVEADKEAGIGPYSSRKEGKGIHKDREKEREKGKGKAVTSNGDSEPPVEVEWEPS
ncbi:uncharacterized protein Z518_02389 [Rhinocladiella mackenziei CBS 650.93]|uniref:DNA-directed RNA polymerase III subunit RPC6 n=1 Tax=Rhinocladiella mackenziei CBS 650.93 TaxID=1442369 RepID=A0A0D2JEW3_9EURO|nr:uncharacterized protein Z518_02389 [Rhinocladiella mackenziei CBS 650.93]KIX07735.1 hypothetical protein Z518_02389 [Rhinocladiella mackenziei CBS 650.93]